MAITLVQYWQQERESHEAVQTAAQSDLAVVQQALVASKATLDASVAALNALGTEIAANKAKLATTSVPSEVTALNAKIRDQLVKQRAFQGGIMDMQEDVAAAQADANAAGATSKRATRRLAECEAGLAEAKEGHKQRQLLVAQLSAAPFDTLQGEASAVLASPAAAAAKATIDANFPPSLQAIAAKRYDTRVARAAQLRQSVTDAEDALGTTLSTNAGLAGAAAQKSTDFAHAEQALRQYVNTAKRRFENAVAVVTALQLIKSDPKQPDIMTAQEKLDVQENKARTDAQANALPIDTARGAVDAARQALDAEIVIQIGKFGEALSSNPAVKGKRDAVAAKVKALRTAQDALVASGERKVLDDWEVVVTDGAWQRLIDYMDATAALIELKAAAPAGLATALTNAEKAYTQALTNAAKAQRQADALADAIAQRVERVESATASLPGRLLSAVRGDSF